MSALLPRGVERNPGLLGCIGIALLVGCSSADTEQVSVGRLQMALTSTTTVSFQEGTSGYSGTTDTQISQYIPTTTAGSSVSVTADGDYPAGAGTDQYALIRWDLSSIPTDATVTAVTMSLRVSNTTVNTYPIYALNRAFDENTATWTVASTGNNWQTLGANGALDRGTTSLGTIAARTTGSYSVTLNSSGLAAVNGWVAAPATNYGFIIASSSSADSVVFDSSEATTAANRPKITVTYNRTVPDGSGGATSTGGAASSGGAASTGGATSTGGGTSTGGATSSFGFFVFSDSHVTSSSSLLGTATAQMELIDRSPIAAISVGDFTTNATTTEWDAHIGITNSYFDSTATTFSSTTPRYLGALGNHDVLGNWYSIFTSHMSGQTGLGQSSSSGVYFATTYQNTQFVVRDAQHVTTAQTQDLVSTLQNSTSKFKFLFFHQPVHSCSTLHPGLASLMPWLDIAEATNVDAVFNGHTHVYSRSCRMKDNVCTTNGTGTVQIETGTVGSTPRAVNVTSATVTGKDYLGNTRSDTYSCSGIPAKLSNANTFCYVRINDCLATVSCYQVIAGNSTPFDTWQINHC